LRKLNKVTTNEEHDYKIIYRTGPQHSNTDRLSRIHVVTSDELISEFQAFKKAEEKLIFNSKITEIEGSIKNAQNNETLIIPISNDKVITHTVIREIINDNKLPPQVTFNESNNFVMINQLDKLIIFYNLKNNHYTEINAVSYYNEIKLFCLNKLIKQFSIIRLEGLTILTCYEQCCFVTYFRTLIFNSNNLQRAMLYERQQYNYKEREEGL